MAAVNAVDYIARNKVKAFIALIGLCKDIVGTEEAVMAYCGITYRGAFSRARTDRKLSAGDAKKILAGYKKLMAENEGSV